MRKFKKKSEEEFDQSLFDSNDTMPQDEEIKASSEEEEKFNPNGIENVIERVTHGLVGTLLIEDGEINKPLFKKGDLVHFITPAKLEKKDFILYRRDEEFFVRRIIKFENEDIYVAGDHEREYHITHKEDVVGKAIGRQRKKKYLSFSLNPTKRFYTFKKVNLAKLRLGNRVMGYDEDMSQESFEIAMQNLDTTTTVEQQPKQVYNTSDLDLDSDLADFLNPDDLVREIRNQNVTVDDEEFEAEEDENQAAEDFMDSLGNEDEVDGEEATESEEETEEDEEEIDEEEV